MHGEQMLNATVHARALPQLVRSRARLRLEDVRWLVGFTHTEESHAESAALRERCAALATNDATVRGGLGALLDSSGGAWTTLATPLRVQVTVGR